MKENWPFPEGGKEANRALSAEKEQEKKTRKEKY